MKRYFCDKCGKEITEKQYERPYFYIRKYDIVNGNHYCKDVVLCEECESEFIKWLGDNRMNVVRCKDCKYNVANMEKDPLDMNDYTDIVCSYFMTDGMEPYDFCSKGELYESSVSD